MSNLGSEAGTYEKLFLLAATYDATRPGEVRMDEDQVEAVDGRYVLTFDDAGDDATAVGELVCAGDTVAGVSISIVPFDDVVVPVWPSATCLDDKHDDPFTLTLTPHDDAVDVVMNDADDYTPADRARMEAARAGVLAAVDQLIASDGEGAGKTRNP